MDWVELSTSPPMASRYIYDQSQPVSFNPEERPTVSTMPGKPAPIKKSPLKKAVKKTPEPTPEPEPAPVEAPPVEAPPAEAAPAEAAPAEPQVNDAGPGSGGDAAPAPPAEEAPAADGSAPGGNLPHKWGLFIRASLQTSTSLTLLIVLDLTLQ